MSASKKLVLFVGSEAKGPTAPVASLVASFAQGHLAVRAKSGGEPSCFEKVWTIDDPAIPVPDLVFTTREGYVSDAVALGVRLGRLYHGLNDSGPVTDKHAMYDRL